MALIAVIAVASAAVGALIVLSTGSGGNNTAGPGTSVPGALAPSGHPATVDPDQALLRRLVVQQADVAPSQSVVLIPGGNLVVGQATLDLCNGTFPSESTRTARLQVAEADAQGNGVLSTEAVLYQSPAATAKGFDELKAAAAKCPSSPVAGSNGEPAVRTTFRSRPDGSWPQTPTVDRLAYDFVMTDNSGQTQHTVAVYLRRGRALLGLYFFTPEGAQPPVAGKTAIPDIVGLFAARLAALPAADVNRTVPASSLS
ncbi:MAG: hypothetical protein JOZ04_12830 [Acidimicrobiia bacterium]|nr:hypothetical protein [Acidimicrobiia bacterium]